MPPAEKPKSKNKLFIVIGFLIVLVFLGGGVFYFLSSRNSNLDLESSTVPTPTNTPQPKTEATFSCADDKTIIAIFNNDTDGSVDLALSDGTKINLPHTASASGAKYANEDESIVFWNTGSEAFLEENGTQTYTDCVAPPSS